MSEDLSIDSFMEYFNKAQDNVEADRQALEGAAQYFEELATMGNPFPIAISQAIRRSLAAEKSADDWADLAGRWRAECIVYENALKTIQEHPHLCGEALSKLAAEALAEGSAALSNFERTNG